MSKRNHVRYRTHLMVFLLLLLVAGVIVYFALRGRVSSRFLIVLILVLSPLVATVLGQLLYWTLYWIL